VWASQHEGSLLRKLTDVHGSDALLAEAVAPYHSYLQLIATNEKMITSWSQ
jgi:hypothetical protein